MIQCILRFVLLILLTAKALADETEKIVAFKHLCYSAQKIVEPDDLKKWAMAYIKDQRLGLNINNIVDQMTTVFAKDEDEEEKETIDDNFLPQLWYFGCVQSIQGESAYCSGFIDRTAPLKLWGVREAISCGCSITENIPCEVYECGMDKHCAHLPFDPLEDEFAPDIFTKKQEKQGGKFICIPVNKRDVEIKDLESKLKIFFDTDAELEEPYTELGDLAKKINPEKVEEKTDEGNEETDKTKNGEKTEGENKENEKKSDKVLPTSERIEVTTRKHQNLDHDEKQELVQVYQKKFQCIYEGTGKPGENVKTIPIFGKEYCVVGCKGTFHDRLNGFCETECEPFVCTAENANKMWDNICAALKKDRNECDPGNRLDSIKNYLKGTTNKLNSYWQLYDANKFPAEGKADLLEVFHCQKTKHFQCPTNSGIKIPAFEYLRNAARFMEGYKQPVFIVLGLSSIGKSSRITQLKCFYLALQQKAEDESLENFFSGMEDWCRTAKGKRQFVVIDGDDFREHDERYQNVISAAKESFTTHSFYKYVKEPKKAYIDNAVAYAKDHYNLPVIIPTTLTPNSETGVTGVLDILKTLGNDRPVIVVSIQLHENNAEHASDVEEINFRGRKRSTESGKPYGSSLVDGIIRKKEWLAAFQKWRLEINLEEDHSQTFVVYFS